MDSRTWLRNGLCLLAVLALLLCGGLALAEGGDPTSTPAITVVNTSVKKGEFFEATFVDPQPDLNYAVSMRDSAGNEAHYARIIDVGAGKIWVNTVRNVQPGSYTLVPQIRAENWRDVIAEGTPVAVTVPEVVTAAPVCTEEAPLTVAPLTVRA